LQFLIFQVQDDDDDDDDEQYYFRRHSRNKILEKLLASKLI
jgi:hypothetical protein